MTTHQLTRCELEVMDIIWESRRATVQDVVDAVERDLAYTTVMTTMKILDRTGSISNAEIKELKAAIKSLESGK